MKLTGPALRRARVRAGLTHIELGKILGTSGGCISLWENELRAPRVGQTAALREFILPERDPAKEIRQLKKQVRDLKRRLGELH